jgi:hypothetical protein
LVVFVACPNSGPSGAAPTITVDDSDGLNVYTQRAVINRDPGATGDGATLGIFTSHITDAVTSGDITVTLSDSAGAKAIQVYRMRPAAGEVIAFVSADSTGDTGSSANIANGAVSVTNGDTIFAGASVETNGSATGDADTTNGSWSAIVNRVADNGGDNTSAASISQYKTVTATGSQAWTATYGGAHDFAASNVILRAAKTLTAAVGSYAITGTAASPKRGRVVVAAAGSYAFTGTDVSLSATGAKIVNAQPGQYDITGTDASTLQAWKPTAAAGSYAFTGTDPATLHGYATAAAAGSYAFTGTDTPVLQARKIVPDAGSYAFTGTDAGSRQVGHLCPCGGSGLLCHHRHRCDHDPWLRDSGRGWCLCPDRHGRDDPARLQDLFRCARLLSYHRHGRHSQQDASGGGAAHWHAHWSAFLLQPGPRKAAKFSQGREPYPQSAGRYDTTHAWRRVPYLHPQGQVTMAIAFTIYRGDTAPVGLNFTNSSGTAYDLTGVSTLTITANPDQNPDDATDEMWSVAMSITSATAGRRPLP